MNTGKDNVREHAPSGFLRFFKGRVRRVLRKAVKTAVFKGCLPRAYSKASKNPVVPNSALFLAENGEKLPDDFKLIYQRFLDGGNCDVSFITLRRGSVGLFKYYGNCLTMVKRAALAETIFLNDTSPAISSVVLREESRVVQLWHACGAFKKWGMSTADLIFGASREEHERFPLYNNLSLVTVSSPEVSWAYEEAMNLKSRRGVVKPLGVSRTDVFFDGGFVAESRKQVEEKVPCCSGKKIILYAPTFRGRVASASSPNLLDIAAMERELSREYILLIKHHPFVKQRPDVSIGLSSFAVDVTDDFAMDVLLCAADVCITDYSSIVFEYSLFERPMIFFAFDRNEYADWRGFYYNYDEFVPGPILCDSDSIIDYIAHVDETFDRNKVIGFKEKYMSACDGHSTDRILEWLLSEKSMMQS